MIEFFIGKLRKIYLTTLKFLVLLKISSPSSITFVHEKIEKLLYSIMLHNNYFNHTNHGNTNVRLQFTHLLLKLNKAKFYVSNYSINVDIE